MSGQAALQMRPQGLGRHAVGTGCPAVALDASECPGEVVPREEGLPEVLAPGRVRERLGGRRDEAALCSGPGRLHRPPPDAGLPRGQDGCGRCPIHESVQAVPRSDVRPFPAWSIPAGTTASADPCRVHQHLAALPVGSPRHPGRSPRIRAAAFVPAPPHLPDSPLVVTDITVLGRLIRAIQPRMRFVSLGSGLCLGLPSDPTSR